MISFLKKFFGSKDNIIGLFVSLLFTVIAGYAAIKLAADLYTVFFGAFFAGVVGLIIYAGICSFKGTDNEGDPTASAIGIAIGIVLLGLLVTFL